MLRSVTFWSTSLALPVGATWHELKLQVGAVRTAKASAWSIAGVVAGGVDSHMSESTAAAPPAPPAPPALPPIGAPPAPLAPGISCLGVSDVAFSGFTQPASTATTSENQSHFMKSPPVYTAP